MLIHMGVGNLHNTKFFQTELLDAHPIGKPNSLQVITII